MIHYLRKKLFVEWNMILRLDQNVLYAEMMYDMLENPIVTDCSNNFVLNHVQTNIIMKKQRKQK